MREVVAAADEAGLRGASVVGAEAGIGVCCAFGGLVVLLEYCFHFFTLGFLSYFDNDEASTVCVGLFKVNGGLVV